MPKHNRFFKNYLINKPFQTRIIYYFTALSLSLVGLQLVFMNIYVSNFRVLLASVPNTPIQSQMLIDAKLTQLISATLGFLLLSIVGAILYGIFVSHRIAGPMFAIIQYIEKLKSGDFVSSRGLRPHDELAPIMTSLHELADTLNKKKK